MIMAIIAMRIALIKLIVRLIVKFVKTLLSIKYSFDVNYFLTLYLNESLFTLVLKFLSQLYSLFPLNRHII